MALLMARIGTTTRRASVVPELAPCADALDTAWQGINSATIGAWSSARPDEALANAVPYLQAFGHGVLAWIWLDVALAALADPTAQDDMTRAGTIGAMQYFYQYELPKTSAWLEPVRSRFMTCANLPEEAF